MGGASTQLLFELEELPAATTCGAGSRSEPSTDVEIRPTPMPQRRRQQWRRQQPQPPTAAEGQAMFGHSKGSSSGSEQQWRRLTLAAPEMLPTRFGEEGGSGRPQTRLLRSIYTQPGSRQSRGGLEGYAVRGVIGDESHCKLQTRVVVAQPLLAQEEIADGGRRPVEGPQTPPVYPWGQRQPQGGWVEREQEGEGEGEEERVAIKVRSGWDLVGGVVWPHVCANGRGPRRPLIG